MIGKSRLLSCHWRCSSGVARAMAILGVFLAGGMAAESNEPIHGEIDPLQLDLEKEGKMETMAMDRWSLWLPKPGLPAGRWPASRWPLG